MTSPTPPEVSLLQAQRKQLRRDLKKAKVEAALMLERLAERDTHIATLEARVRVEEDNATEFAKRAVKQRERAEAAEARLARASRHYDESIEVCREWIAENEQLKARLAEAGRDAERLGRLLRECDTAAKVRGQFGVSDCIDNDGTPYQSDELFKVIAALKDTHER